MFYHLKIRRCGSTVCIIKQCEYLSYILQSHVRRDLRITKECIVMHTHLKIVYKWALQFNKLAITRFNNGTKLLQALINAAIL